MIKKKYNTLIVKKELIFFIQLFTTSVLISLVITMLWFLVLNLKNKNHFLILKFSHNNNVNSAGLNLRNLDELLGLKETIMNYEQVLNFYNHQIVKKLLSMNSEISKDNIKIVIEKNQRASIITLTTGKALDIKYVDELSKDTIKILELKIYAGYKTQADLQEKNIYELKKSKLFLNEPNMWENFFNIYENSAIFQKKSILALFFDDQKRLETSLFDYEIFQDYA